VPIKLLRTNTARLLLSWCANANVPSCAKQHSRAILNQQPKPIRRCQYIRVSLEPFATALHLQGGFLLFGGCYIVCNRLLKLDLVGWHMNDLLVENEHKCYTPATGFVQQSATCCVLCCPRKDKHRDRLRSWYRRHVGSMERTMIDHSDVSTQPSLMLLSSAARVDRRAKARACEL
jgi:hypothetical protein